MKYFRLTIQERLLIEQHIHEKKSVSWIAKALNRSKSTISQELRRGNLSAQNYRHKLAQRHADLCKRRRAKGLKLKGQLRSIIFYYLFEWHCSPEQISGRLKRDFPDDTEFHISYEALYRYIYRSGLGRKITSCLRRKHKKRQCKKKVRKDRIRNKRSIHERGDLSDRQEFGHWEGDLIIGKDNQSAMGTLVERSSRYTLIIPLESKDSLSVVNAFTKAFEALPAHLRKSLTYDQGSEMACHELLTTKLGLKVYFADAGQPQQRGSNENTNGLIREYFPKKTNLSEYSQEEVVRVQEIINSRPKKVLAYSMPKEVFRLALANPELTLAQAI